MSEATDVRVDVRTADHMRELGEAVGSLLTVGQIIVLTGPLGAGKTTFVQGVARACGVTEPVTSPTFVIARVHRGSVVTLVHVDAYRLSSPRDLSALDMDEEIERGVTFVEWGAHVMADQDHLAISIDRGRDDDVRVVTLPAVLASAVTNLHK